MEENYNGYKMAKESNEPPIYNPTASLNYLHQLLVDGKCLIYCVGFSDF